MVKISRVLLLIVIFLSIVSLIAIFATALFSGGGDGSGTTAPATSGSEKINAPETGAPSSPQPSGTPSPQLTDTPMPTGTGSGASDPLPVGGRIAFKAPGSENTFFASVDGEQFRRVQEGAEAFFDATVENNSVFIEFCYFPEMITEASAPRFLDVYSGSAPTVDRGEESIGATGLSGRAIEASDGTKTFEAWLLDENQGGALAIVMSYSTTSQRDALYAIFDSLALAG
jgi:hypothetical protein